jgi:multiple sugar transport system permease protein
MHMSLYHNVLIRPQDYRFIGLGNYARMVQDPTFWLTLKNSFTWVFWSVSLQFVCGFAAALLLNAPFKGRAFFRTINPLPWIIPGVVVALVWEYLYQPNYGSINDLLRRIGWMREPVAWLSDINLAMPAVVFTVLQSHAWLSEAARAPRERPAAGPRRP